MQRTVQWHSSARRLASALVWTLIGSSTLSAQLNLPYTGSGNNSTYLFQLTQNGTGAAIKLFLANGSATQPALFVQTVAPGPAIFGRSLATSGFTYGARFEAQGPQARGVLGYALSTTGASFGVYGLSDSVAGAGVFGWARATSGTTYGVYGQVSSPNGYAGYFVGRGYFSGNVGIGTSSPSAKLHVQGTAYFNGNVGIGTGSPSVRLSLGGDNANTKLAIWDGGTSGVMGFGVGPAQFRIHLPSPSNRFSFLDAPNGNEIVTFQGNGNVGIGTSSPQARLHVSGDAFFTNNNTTFQVLPGSLLGQGQANAATLEIPGDGTIGVWDNMTISGTLRTYGNLHVGGNTFTLGGSTDPNWRRVRAWVDDAGGGSYVGVVETLGANGNPNTRLTWIAGYPNHGSVGVYDSDGTRKAAIYVSSNGDGVLFTTQKSFREPDPDDPTRDIWYGCIEGPELAMYVRGTARLVNGRARIELPDHFRKLADEQGMTVQLTPRSAESRGLAAVRVSLDGIEVVELLNGRGNYEFDWRVEAVRKDHRDFRVYRPWDEVLTAGEDPAQAWQARLKSIEERKARQKEANP